MKLAYVRLFLLSFSGCGAVEPEPSLCPEAPPTCITRSESCGAPATADPVCAERVWSCPAGSREYDRAAAATSSCLPFSGIGTPLTGLGGSLARVPIDAGRCLWVAETATNEAGDSFRNVGLLPPAELELGACPLTSTFGGGEITPVVEIEGDDDDGLLVQIDSGFVDSGETRVLYRLFRTDPQSAYGVSLLGGGFGRWDATKQRIVVPSTTGLQWDPSIDPGDASLVLDGTPYIWGCHAPIDFLSSPCALGRLEDGQLELYTKGDAWTAGADVEETSTMFESGPWISSVVTTPAATLLHVYASGFGTTLQTHTATHVTGPWSPGATLATCDLPSIDPHAFCAGPVVHTELMDPTRPGELVVSHGVGSTASVPADTGTLATTYWTRLVWATLPPE
jgi:hypothetical protein